jgi:hypothetical protein
LERADIMLNDVVWHATSIGYKNSELYSLYEKARQMVFKKLEPEAALENAAHPEWYGQICNMCEVWTRSHVPTVCAFCGGELVPFPLNDDVVADE